MRVLYLSYKGCFSTKYLKCNISAAATMELIRYPMDSATNELQNLLKSISASCGGSSSPGRFATASCNHFVIKPLIDM